MVKKKGQKSAQSKKKLDLAAAVEAAEQGEEESDLSKLNLDSDDLHTASTAKNENGNVNDNETGAGNDDEDNEEEAVVMNYNPPEEGPVTEQTGKTVITLLTFLFCFMFVHVTTRYYRPFCFVVQSATQMCQSKMIFNLNINIRVNVKYSSLKKGKYKSFG